MSMLFAPGCPMGVIMLMSRVIAGFLVVLVVCMVAASASDRIACASQSPNRDNPGQGEDYQGDGSSQKPVVEFGRQDDFNLFTPIKKNPD